MKPFISVIVPAWNDEDKIGSCIESLLKQTYPKDRYEILVVDNLSTDRTKSIIESTSVTLLEEKDTQSSYAARNRAIKASKGEILFFTDSDCVVDAHCLEKGVAEMNSSDVGLVAGRIKFILRDQTDPYEIYDAINHMQQKDKVTFRNEAVTANLFGRKEIFEDIGLFEEVYSGGDGLWTAKATNAGYKLHYCEGAYVSHPTRTKDELKIKRRRVGRGQIKSWNDKGYSRLKICVLIIKEFLPPYKINRSKLKENEIKVNLITLFRLYFVTWWAAIHLNLGRLEYLKSQKTN